MKIYKRNGSGFVITQTWSYRKLQADREPVESEQVYDSLN